jgi:hypothetical protein
MWIIAVHLRQWRLCYNLLLTLNCCREQADASIIMLLLLLLLLRTCSASDGWKHSEDGDQQAPLLLGLYSKPTVALGQHGRCSLTIRHCAKSM